MNSRQRLYRFLSCFSLIVCAMPLAVSEDAPFGEPQEPAATADPLGQQAESNPQEEKAQEPPRSFWEELDAIHNAHDISYGDFRVPFDSSRTGLELLGDAWKCTERLNEFVGHLARSHDKLPEDLDALMKKIDVDPALVRGVPHEENPVLQRNHDWEVLNLGMPNFVTVLQLDLAQMKVRYLELLKKSGEWDDDHEKLLEEARETLKKIVSKQPMLD